MKKLYTTLFAFALFTNLSFGQVVVYDIKIDSTIGLSLTSGDICTNCCLIEEAKQNSAGNTWGAMWTSTNMGNATAMTVELMFSISDGLPSHTTTLNAIANNTVDPGAAINCGLGSMLTWNIDPTNYNEGGLNTFLVDYSNSVTVNQLDNLPFGEDPYMRITVTYDPGVGIEELSNKNSVLVRITDLLGRETEFKPNTPLLYHYSDGSIVRKFKLE